MRSITQDLFSPDAKSLATISAEWKSRQHAKGLNPDALDPVWAHVDSIAEIVQSAEFDNLALPSAADETHRRLIASYIDHATCGLLALRVRRSLDAWLERSSSGIPDRSVLVEQARRLRLVAVRYASPSKDSARI